MTKIKICGITNINDALWAVNLGCDILGFVFAKSSKRKVSPQKAKEIISQLPAFVKKVGVFVDEDSKAAEKTAKSCGLDTLQFHGQETPEYCAYFKSGFETIKSFRIKDEASLAGISDYDTDYILLDTFVDGVEGGTGNIFNWDLAVKAKEAGKPVFLAGGLNVLNIAEAIKKVQPYAVDVASGIERIPGKKDYEAMKEFIAKARKAG